MCLQIEIAKRAGYQVTPGGTADVFYVKNVKSPEGKEYEVNLAKPDCCDYVRMHLMPCRHMVPVFYQREMMSTQRQTMQTINAFWPKWAHASEYLKHYTDKSIRRPEMYCGPFLGAEEDRLLRPIQSRKKRGRPKRARYRWTAKTVTSVIDAMPVQYNREYAEVLEFL